MSVRGADFFRIESRRGIMLWMLVMAVRYRLMSPNQGVDAMRLPTVHGTRPVSLHICTSVAGGEDINRRRLVARLASE